MSNRSAIRHRNVRNVQRQLPPPVRPRRPLPVILLASLAGAVLAAAGAYYAMAPAPYETVELKSGTVELTMELDALIVRKEQVYTAPVSGKVWRLADEGQRVRVGSVVAQILPGPAAATPAAPPQTPAVGGTPGAASPATPASGGTNAALRRQIDDLSEQIYTTALAWNEARSKGDTAATNRLQEELDQLGARQRALAEQLGRAEPVGPVAASPAPAAPAQGQTQPQPGSTAAQPGAGPTRVAGGTDMAVGQSGVLVYQADGLEGALVPGGTAQWTPTFIRSLTPEPRKTGDTVAQGAPVFKVVDNLSLSLLAVVPAGSLGDLGLESRVLVRFPGRDVVPVAARVTRGEPVGGEMLITLSAPVFPEEFTHLRRTQATLVFGSFEGKVAPRSAIDVRDGLQGVWAVKGAEPVFYTARVLGGNSDEVALETDLPPGVQILKQAPTWMR